MNVVTCGEIQLSALQDVLSPYGIDVLPVPDAQPIPGNHFGDPEAGLIAHRLYIRSDTPVHSALHEACLYFCMDSARGASLHTDAGGGYYEEIGVCYLQILLAARVRGYSLARMLTDMDAWGYSFRLGSAQAWFEQDAEDALAWLIQHDVLDSQHQITWRRVPSQRITLRDDSRRCNR